MNHTKRLLSILLAAMLALGLFAPLAHAAPGDNTQILTVGGDDSVFEYFNGQEWKALVVPFWITITGDEKIAYCLESNKDQPMGDGYSVASALYSENVLKGVRAILLYGYPNVTGGLDVTAAWYTTQAAIWTFMYEAAGVGYESLAEHNIRPAAGNQAAYTFYLTLLDYARRGVDAVDYSYRYSPSTLVLTPNGSGQLVGTATMELLDNVGSYSIDQGKLPAGVTLTGVTYLDGDVFTLTVPISYAGRTELIRDCFRLNSTRSPANIFWFEPDASDPDIVLQNMVVYDMAYRPMYSGGVMFTSEEIKQSRITIQKTNAAPSLGSYSLLGASFHIYSNGAVVDTVTTDANGRAQSKLLDIAAYEIREIFAPFGYVRNDTIFTADLNTEAVTVTVPQQPQAGVIRIHKTNADPANGDYSLAGAVFEVCKPDGTRLELVTTDSSGFAQSKKLPLGEYFVLEKDPPEGFLRNDTVYPVNLEYGGQEATVVYADVNVPEQPQMGKITIKKVNANPALGDYSLQGAVFEIYSGNTLVDTVTTDANGNAQSKSLKLDSYTVKEKTAPYGFVLNTTSFTANLEYAGQDVELAVVSVTIPEEPQRGVIRVAKANANPSMGDYSLAGAVFEVRTAGGTLVDTITTDAQGKANSQELPLGSYTVSEKTAPHGFVRNQNTFSAQLAYAGQDVSIVYADVVVAEQPQVGTITVTKKDAVTGSTAQGDAILSGAVFEVFASDKTTLVDTLYCGAGVTATSKELPLGTFYVREKASPTGYSLDSGFHKAELVYAWQDVEVTSVNYDLKNQVIQGQIAIVKHLDAPMDGYDDPQIEQPLADAKFHVYLKSAGSYDNAKDTERDLLITNENGWALSKKLPYGLYTVAEVEAPGDVKFVEPFQVFVSQEGKTYYFILENLLFRSQVKVVKVDAETGKPILLAGTAFKIRDLSTGDWVTQHVNYPVPRDISEFMTAADGTLVLPEPLKSGEYELAEVAAPRGYLLSDKPVKFIVHSSNGQETVTVTMENKPVMGKIKVEKTGNMLVGAKEIETIFGKQYLPVFEMGFLVGAEFDVIAAEDIITPDGTVRAKKGDVVDRIVTGADGRALSKELYLGEYELVETKAPPNYVLDPTPYPVSLVYEDQTVAVVTSQIGIMNTRQLVEIELLKRMEGFDKFDKFEDVIFGLYTAQDIYAEDGKLLIAKDSLILTQDSLMALSALDDDGRGRFEGELPFAKYYVLELQTAEGFILDSTKYPVDASYAGEGDAVTRIKVNGGEPIVNKRALGELRILKLDAYTHEPLQGAKFGLYQGETLIGEAVTDEDGYARFSDLPHGEYQVRELEAPDGYVLVDEIYAIIIREEGQKVLLEVLNQKQPGEPDLEPEPDPEPKPVPEPQPEPEPEPDKPVPPCEPPPKTGDDSKLTLWLGLLCIGAGGTIALLLIRRKKKDETEDAADET